MSRKPIWQPTEDEAKKIAEALLKVEELGMELLEAKVRFKDKSGYVNFVPDAWRNYGRKQQLKMLFVIPDKENIACSKHVICRGMF